MAAPDAALAMMLSNHARDVSFIEDNHGRIR
jgi:hypothetical protein